MAALGQAYLLAAGMGRRAGGPKAWRDFKGKTLLARQIEFLRGLFPAQRIAVSIQPGWGERCRVLDPGVCWMEVDSRAPTLASVLALTKALPLNCWTFLYHVDMRVWEPELFHFMADRISAAEKDGIEALVPSFHGVRGHPVLLSPVLKEGLAGLDPTRDRLDHWLASRRVAAVEVPFACIRDNWNGRGQAFSYFPY